MNIGETWPSIVDHPLHCAMCLVQKILNIGETQPSNSGRPMHNLNLLLRWNFEYRSLLVLLCCWPPPQIVLIVFSLYIDISYNIDTKKFHRYWIFTTSPFPTDATPCVPMVMLSITCSIYSMKHRVWLLNQKWRGVYNGITPCNLRWDGGDEANKPISHLGKATNSGELLLTLLMI